MEITVKDLLNKLNKFDDDCVITLRVYHNWEHLLTDDFDVDFKHYEYEREDWSIAVSKDVELDLDYE